MTAIMKVDGSPHADEIAIALVAFLVDPVVLYVLCHNGTQLDYITTTKI